MLQDFMTNKITLVRTDGTSQELFANIQSTGITIQDVKVKVTEGDEIHHTNPAGISEVYEVDQVTYSASEIVPEDMHHISIKFTKVGSRKHRESKTPTYNLINSNLSINSSHPVQGNIIKIDIEDFNITDDEILNLLRQLQNEISKQDKNERVIKSIFNKILDKTPDILIAIATRLITG